MTAAGDREHLPTRTPFAQPLLFEDLEIEDRRDGVVRHVHHLADHEVDRDGRENVRLLACQAIAPGKFYATVGFPLKASGEVPPYHAYLDGQRIGGLENLSEDLTLAARYALLDMIDYIEREHGLRPRSAVP